MQEIPQINIIETALKMSVDREELLLKKYDEYMEEVKDATLRKMLKEFAKTSQDHIKRIKDKLSVLNIK